eukprot:jgi/Tetstr1/430964/TSEL_020719.t1
MHFLHFAETVAVMVLGDVFDSAEHHNLAVMWHVLQGAIIHYLRDCEECDAPADNEERQCVNEYIKKQRKESFNCLLTYAQMCIMHLHDEMMKRNLHNLWEAAVADDAVDMFEGAGPGCMGAAVQQGTSAAPATLTARVVALDTYCQGAGKLEHEPAWKREYETRGLNPHEIK